MSALTVGSLFSGIGGLDLGLERAGFDIRWQSEVDPYCCRVLTKHWPDIPNLGDVREVDWSTVERVDLICGGYPCQPFSSAGIRRGRDDSRHLWPWFFDAIRFLRPHCALLENVAGHLSLGFDRVLADLASIGWDAQWSTVTACAVGAPQVRRRLFCVAYPSRGGITDKPSCGGVAGLSVGAVDRAGDRAARRDLAARAERPGRSPGVVAADVADPEGNHGSHAGSTATRGQGGRRAVRRSRSGEGEPQRWLPEPAVDRVVDGVPNGLVRASLEALGNAVVPQVAEFIGRQILQAIERSA